MDNKYQLLKAYFDKKGLERLESQLLKYVSKYFDENSLHRNLLAGNSSRHGGLDIVPEDDNELDMSMVSDKDSDAQSVKDKDERFSTPQVTETGQVRGRYRAQMSDNDIMKYKKLYKDAIERVFYQFNRSLVNECFMDKRINDRISNQDSKNAVDLDDLYKNVIEDDKTQPDPSMSLWLDATLIRKFYYKLEPSMK